MKADCNDCNLKDVNEYEEETANIMNEEETESTAFWFEDPNILLNTKYVYEFYPTDEMDYNRMLNAVSRSVILLTLIVFAINPGYRVLSLFALTMGIIFLMHHYKNKEGAKKEGFDGVAKEYLESMGQEVGTEHVFTSPSSSNPFGNVLMTDYVNAPEKRPAPPSYNGNIQEKIKDAAKAAVQEANPDHPGLADKIFKGLGDEMNFDQSLRQFSSMPSTTIPNDQEAFANFCYGSMVSCKEGNGFACARNLSRHTNY